MIEPTATNPTSVYVHFPWCARKCPYCDFATQPAEPSAIPGVTYADAVRRELQWRASTIRAVPRELTSVFFGGGTPSLWAAGALGSVLDDIMQLLDTPEPHQVEVTAECNPASMDPQQLESFRAAGVNRVSIGTQSLQDRHLAFLGRLHDGAAAKVAVSQARQVFDRVSADLMFGMPGQSPDELQADIRALVDLGATHLSVYALTVEAGTPFGARQRAGRLPIATEDSYVDLYESAEDTLRSLGFEHYEVSNYAQRGEVSRHNAHYWRGGEYVGLGAAAVGCLNKAVGKALRWKNRLNPARYQDASSLSETELQTEDLGQRELGFEHLMLGLRTTQGVDLDRHERRAGADLLADRAKEVQSAIERGNLVKEGRTLRVPQEKWLKLDGIVRDLF